MGDQWSSSHMKSAIWSNLDHPDTTRTAVLTSDCCRRPSQALAITYSTLQIIDAWEHNCIRYILKADGVSDECIMRGCRMLLLQLRATALILSLMDVSARNCTPRSRTAQDDRIADCPIQWLFKCSHSASRQEPHNFRLVRILLKSCMYLLNTFLKHGCSDRYLILYTTKVEQGVACITYTQQSVISVYSWHVCSVHDELQWFHDGTLWHTMFM